MAVRATSGNYLKYIHYVAGFLTAMMPTYLAVLSFLSFVFYEVFEYIKLRDTLYLEIREYAVGLYLGGLLRVIVCIMCRCVHFL